MSQKKIPRSCKVKQEKSIKQKSKLLTSEQKRQLMGDIVKKHHTVLRKLSDT